MWGMDRDELLARVRALRRLPPPETRRTIRVAAGVSQAAVADALGVSQASVGYWEAGSRTPRGDHAAAYLLLLDELSRAASHAA